MDNIFLKATLKYLTNDVQFKVDREKRLVLITTPAETTQYTYEEIIDIAEDLLNGTE